MINYINIFIMINSFLKVKYLLISRFICRFIVQDWSFMKFLCWNNIYEEIKIIAIYERRSFPLNKDTNNNFTIACKF